MAFKKLPQTNLMYDDEVANDPSQKIWKASFTFIVGSDTQFGMMGSYIFEKDEPEWKEEVRLTKLAIMQINQIKPKPRFLVICGDMLDALPFNEPPKYYKHSKLNDIDLRQLQYKDFTTVFQELDPEIKLVVVPGNHDLGDIPTKESLDIYRKKEFGSDYYHFWVGGVKFVVLNSQLFVAPELVSDDAEKHWKYLDTIKDPQAKHIVVFQHIPFFQSNPDEGDNYRIFPKAIRFKVLDHLAEQGVTHIFSGHCHENSSGKYKSIELNVTSALGCPMGTDCSGYRIVTVNETSITSRYVEIDSLQKKKYKKKKCCCFCGT